MTNTPPLKHIPYVIAEIANAHNGDYSMLTKLIEEAAKTGAHGVKFQWFRPETLAMPDFEWYPVYEKLMFTEDQWDQAIDLAVKLDLDVWADATDGSSISRIERNKVKIFGLKIPPSTILETDHAKAVLAFGKTTLIGIGGHEDSVIEKTVAAFRAINDNIILQHGFQGYPTLPEDATLARLAYLKHRYQLPVAYADHEQGGSDLALSIPEYAYFAGACLLEKHICLDRSTEPYDHYSSLEPEEFTKFMKNMGKCTAIMGDIRITDAQKKYLSVASRAILSKPVKAGETILPQDILFRRTPEKDALTPDVFEKILPAVAVHDMPANHPVQMADIKKLKIVVVVPCRLNSTRLQKKALLPIAGIPSIQRCLINIKQIRFVDDIVLATSINPEDAPLVDVASAIGIETFRGSENDVLQRIISIGEKENADIVLRLTGDCPVISFEIMEHMILDHITKNADLTYCHDSVAVGTVGDVYSFSALKRLRNAVPEALYSEYLSYYFINNPDMFTVNKIQLPAQWAHPEWRLTLDEQSDLELLNEIYDYYKIGHDPISFKQIIDFFSLYPEKAAINQGNKLKYKADADFIKKLNDATLLPGQRRTA